MDEMISVTDPRRIAASKAGAATLISKEICP